MFLKGIPVFVVLLVCPTMGFSQTPNSADLIREQIRIQQQQQQLIDEQIRQRELRDAATRPQPLSPPAEAASAPEIARCADIKQIEFSGNTILSDERIKGIIEPYLNRCLSVEQINALLNEITNIYIEKGYATSRAFMVMPQTRLKEGILEIRIVEGKLAKVYGLKAGEQLTAFPFLEDNFLNLRDIEQGLDQINRLGSNRAAMEIRASEAHYGQSDIVVRNEPLGRTNIGFTFDNLGSESTGQNRATIKIGVDNMLGLNDQISLSYTNALASDRKNRDSRSVLLSFSVPLGWWTFSNNLSYSYYKTSFPMPVSGDRFYSLGDSYTNSFSIDRMLFRGRDYKLSAAVGITYKENNNYMQAYDLKIKNEASSRALSIVNFDLPGTFYFPRGLLYVKPSWLHGIRAFGAFDDSNSSFSQKAQFDAYKLFLNGNFNFGYASLNTAIDSQYSKHELFSTEAFYIGGEPSVRGFTAGGVQGDSGFYIRNDLSLNLGHLLGSQNRYLSAFSPSLFVDYGRVFPNARNAVSSSLSGAGVKLGFRYWLIDAGVTYAKILQKEEWIKEKHAVYAFVGISGRF